MLTPSLLRRQLLPLFFPTVVRHLGPAASWTRAGWHPVPDRECGGDDVPGAVNPKRQREESQLGPACGQKLKSLKPSESVSATATKAAIEALAEQVLNGERCGGCRLVLRKHEKNFSCTSTKRRRGGGRGKYVCAHQFCTECINGPFRVMYAHDELGTTSSDYAFTPPKEWQCPS